MTQIIEYALVLLISTLFAGASAATYSAYQSFEGNAQFGASASEVSSLAEQAVEIGTSRANMFLAPSTISCSLGVLSFASNGRTEANFLPVGCDFRTVVPGGLHSIQFSFGSSTLKLQVE